MFAGQAVSSCSRRATLSAVYTGVDLRAWKGLFRPPRCYAAGGVGHYITCCDGVKLRVGDHGLRPERLSERTRQK